MDPDLLQLENEADKFAAQTLIPPRYERRLKEIRFADIPVLAEEIGVAPAVVVGRLHHEGILKYSQGNKMRRRYEFKEPVSN
jgi:HTH-type transcriptional regulator / antitoxin HigA